jgi:predicted ATPase/class 3 adenylate cyclase/TolA-binding protein
MASQEPIRSEASRPLSGVMTFLFADVRGYTHFTVEHGDEAAARLATRFAAIAREVIARSGGDVYELVGDQAVAVFASAREAFRAAVALQQRMADERAADPSFPVTIGIGLDAGEAVPVEGGYRGGALNLAARLCARAEAGEIFASEGLIHLARLVDGIDVRDRGLVGFKGMTEPVRVLQIGAAGTLPESLPPLETPMRPTNLPAQLTSFIGREAERARVKDLLAASRLVTLTGTGGAGKTRLALQVAEEVLERYRDGVWLVELAPVSDPELVLQTVALALGLQEQPDRALADALIDFVLPKQMLLVLDNCEHVLAACRRLTDDLLKACPRLSILATSREVLSVVGETPYRVPSLGVPIAAALSAVEELEQKDATRLFLERARTRRTDFAVTQENARAVAEICIRLDGVPLAIELAAARVGVLAPQQLLRRLEDRFRVLSGGAATAPSRQRTLRATLDWSYDLLAGEDRVVLQRLAVFAGGCSLEAAESVCAGEPVDEAAILDLLESLVNKSLVQMEELAGEARYSLLETVRQYAQEHLHAAGEAEGTGRTHADWYAEFARQAEPALLGGLQLAWLDRLELERDNLRAAMDWSVTHAGRDEADAERALSLAAALWRFWELRGPLSEGRRWLEEALQASGAVHPAYRARALTALGHLAVAQGDVSAARAALEEAIAIWRDCPQRPERQRGEGLALLDLGNAALARADSDEAGARFAESLAWWRQLGEDWGIASALEGLGRAAQKRLSIEGRWSTHGEVEGAKQLYEQSLAIRDKIGDAWGVARAYMNLARIEMDLGAWGQATERFQQALARARDLRDVHTTGVALTNLASMAVYAGQAVEAEEPLNAALTLYRQVGATAQSADALYWLGDAAMLREEMELAGTHFAEAEEIYARLGHVDGRAWMRSCRGAVLQSVGRYDEAAELLEQSLRLYRPDDQGTNPAIARLNLGETYFGQGRLEEAVAEYCRCLRMLRDHSSPENSFVVSWTLTAQAQLAASRGEFERAAHLLSARAAIRPAMVTMIFPAERAELEHAERLSRTALGEAAFALALSAMENVGVEEAIALGLDTVTTG